ncbi:hypothetical protein KEM60_02397 [Austwickia sp. TVS 96-490-7B]|uniref:helix-turn-helix domain-containing protein n=1 Tax=Austwickia sp. TVS 96-490-7B TaxID=2830843 RepID=UPI001C599C4B|nr:helix-turn-helix transcriptional regulator [Austwickia sp. TVS 96-490-7B]MBW3086186.1 hypothetical protein [Austwickia sp. TVS 96-490-7B]
MSIIVRLDVEMAKQKMGVAQLSQAVGMTPANISILKNGRARAVRLSTLDSLCRVLTCTPGDLLEWVPDD